MAPLLISASKRKVMKKRHLLLVACALSVFVAGASCVNSTASGDMQVTAMNVASEEVELVITGMT